MNEELSQSDMCNDEFHYMFDNIEKLKWLKV